MKIKRIVAPDIRSGMRKMKEMLGDDSVILVNRKSARGVELIVGVDYDPDALHSISKAAAKASVFKQALPELRTRAKHYSNRDQTNSRSLSNTRSGGRRSNFDTQAVNKQLTKADVIKLQQPILQSMRNEMASLNNMMQSQMDYLSWGKWSNNTPQQANLLRQLTAIGLGSQFCKEIIDSVSSDLDSKKAWQRALGVWAHRLRVINENIINQGGTVALIGPTGVGKTTTAAKLAARFAERHGKNKVLLVANDNQRIGAQEQLLGLGRALGVSVVSAMDDDELREILINARNKRLVLIDTAGWHPQDSFAGAKRRLIFDYKVDIQRYLVLSCNSQIGALDSIVNTYSHLNIDGCILTKLDEAASLGGVLTVVASHNLPLAYVTHGHKVPEDIQPARVPLLLGKAVALSKGQKCQPDEDIMAIRYGRSATKLAV